MLYDKIAVIGMSGRFAGTRTFMELRKLLKSGKDDIAELSDKRKELLGLPQDKIAMQIGELKDIDCFDHSFFSIPSKEADFMCPEQRLGLELAADAVLNAGYSLEQFRGKKCGVLVSCSDISYNHDGMNSNSMAVLGTMKMMISARIAYFLDARGINMNYDSGCSSSLVAIHEACTKLTIGELDYALVGGISLITDVQEGGKHKYKTMGLLSPQFRSKAFDESADGTSAGEGGAFVVLKRLEDALEDKDFIYGVIDAGAINGDGGRCSKLTMPSPKAQEEVISDTWNNVDISNLTEIEAHGIGNKIGDSVEAEKLIANLQRQGLDKKKIYLSSVKTNIGHLYEASGIAGLYKVLLGFYYHEAYPMANFMCPNALIPFESVNLLPLKEVHYFGKDEKRMAAIDAFGIGGANAHIVVENYISQKYPDCGGPCLLKISAATEDAFYQNCEDLADFLLNSDARYQEVSYTMNTGRDDYSYRRMFCCEDRLDMIEKLQMIRPAHREVPAKLVFVLKHTGYDETKSLRYEDYESLFPGLKDCVEHELDDLDVNFKCTFFRYLTECGLCPDYVLADECGKEIIKYISGELDRETLKKMSFEKQDEDYGNVFVKLEQLAQTEELLIVDFSMNGLLKKSLRLGNVVTAGLSIAREMASLFVRFYNMGKDISWIPFYKEKMQKTALPGYSFTKIRHWIPISNQKKLLQEETERVNLPEDDRKALISNETKPVQEKVSVEEEIKKFLEDLWMKLLNFSGNIDYDEDFFYLGGNSLLIELMSKPINNKFQIDFDIYQIYENETINKLAKCIYEYLEDNEV